MPDFRLSAVLATAAFFIRNPEDVLGPVRKLVRQRGPSCPGGAT